MEKLDLAHRWAKMWKDADYVDLCWFMLERLIDRYSASGRHYHTLAHIEFCLDVFEKYRHRAKDPLAVQLVIWFHDVIYDASRTDNELQSAKFFMEFAELIGLPLSLREAVYKMIIATTHKIADRCSNSDAYLALDIDLASLGLAWEDFQKGTKDILLEGAEVPDYDGKNRKFLKTLLRRPQIYLTKEVRVVYEHTARENIRRRLAA